MKSIVVILSLVISSACLCQEYKSGDKELDASLSKIDVEAKSKLNSLKSNWASEYNTSLESIDGLFKKGMSAGDVFMSLEMAKITKKPLGKIIVVYEAHKNEGWGVIAKELGIKPGSAEFHELKASAKNKPGKKSVKGQGKPEHAKGKVKSNKK